MTMMNKKLLLSFLAMILPKINLISRPFEYLKNLSHIDFSVTDHICISYQRFLEYYLIDRKEKVWMGDGSINAIGMGTVRLELTKLDRSFYLVILHNVLHTPFFMTNLISVSLLQK